MSWYLVITEEMRNLGLKGNDLLVYAMIAGYSQREMGCYYGTQQHLADVCGITKRTAMSVLDKLVASGQIEKSEYYENGLRRCAYRIVEADKEIGEKNSPMQVKNFHQIGEKNSPSIDEGISTIPQWYDKINNIHTLIARESLLRLIDDGCAEQSLKDWLAVRKQKRSPMFSQSAYNRFVREAEAAGVTVAEAMDLTAEFEWVSFTAKFYQERCLRSERQARTERKVRSVYQQNLEQMRRAGLVPDDGGPSYE